MDRIIVAIGLMYVLAACQTDQTVSLAEAKQISATFQGPSFTPPPKTIKDITAILDEQAVANPEDIQSMSDLADSQPPEGARPNELANFYLKRGRAAIALGRSDQWLRDYRKAESFIADAQSLNRNFITDLRNRVGQAEQSFGNFEDAEKQFLLNLNTQESVGTMRHLVRFYADIGDLDAAEIIRDRAVTQLVIQETKHSTSVSLLAYNRQYIDGMIHAARGEWRESERNFRDALETGKLHAEYYDYSYLNTLAVIGRYLTNSLIRQGRIFEAVAHPVPWTQVCLTRRA